MADGETTAERLQREQEAMASEAAPEQVKPPQTLEGVMGELKTVIQAFSVTPQVVNVAFVQFKDPADQDVLLAVSLFRVGKAPVINVTDSYDEQAADAAERYRIFASAPSEKEGIEALMQYMAEKAEAAPAAEEGESADEEDQGKTVLIG